MPSEGGGGGEAEEKCPVDHRTREAWLQAVKAKASKNSTPSPTPKQTTAHFSLDTFTWLSQPPPPPPPPQQQQQQQPTKQFHPLPTDRQISSIPRAISHPSTLNSAQASSNNEVETGHDTTSGNWIYPSQSQFFDAMKRKGHPNPNPQDMSSIVPIHNAVNERAWEQIQQWEKGWGSERCGGPKLLSFAGDSKKLTPKAYWNVYVMGYKKPFDRHDWVVDRCGTPVEYVIDFYKGKEMHGVPLAFYLDVRPKVNGWEGLKMRVARMLGF